MTPFKSGSELGKKARENPTEMKAYICNFKQHWYTIRRIGNYWFNLNSMLRRPELITDTYLAVLLKQLETDGYSIFIVDGDLPVSEADRCLFEEQLDTRQILRQQIQDRARSSSENDGFEDDELKRAIKMSLIENDKDLDSASNNKVLSNIVYDDSDLTEENNLKRAIELSLEVNFEF